MSRIARRIAREDPPWNITYNTPPLSLPDSCLICATFVPDGKLHIPSLSTSIPEIPGLCQGNDIHGWLRGYAENKFREPMGSDVGCFEDMSHISGELEFPSVLSRVLLP
jgi:hypothetical protein